MIIKVAAYLSPFNLQGATTRVNVSTIQRLLGPVCLFNCFKCTNSQGMLTKFSAIRCCANMAVHVIMQNRINVFPQQQTLPRSKVFINTLFVTLSSSSQAQQLHNCKCYSISVTMALYTANLNLNKQHCTYPSSQAYILQFMYYPTTELNGLIKLEPQHLQHNTNSENLMQLGDNIS